MPATTLSGKLVNPALNDFSRYRVSAEYLIGTLESRQSTEAAVDGSFAMQLPEDGTWTGPLTLTATAVSGVRLGQLTDLQPTDNLSNLELKVEPDIGPVVVDPSQDPALGTIARFTGRLITSTGESQRPGLMVVIWGVSPGAPQPHAIAVAETIGGGYFSGEWPPAVISSAFARIDGGASISIPLDGDRLPKRIILVADTVPAEDAPEGAPPRAPSADDLAANSDTFAADISGCVDFTIPNRTVEEVTFQAVVRTSQPEIRGNRRPQRPKLPRDIYDRLKDVASAHPYLAALRAGQDEPRPNPEGVRLNRASALLNANRIALAAAPENAADFEPDAVAMRVLAATERTFELEDSVLAELVREPGGISPVRLFDAHKTSILRDVRNQLALLTLAPVARFDLDADHQADWDALPYAYQATTVAHGHILTMKQVWRADGYSLGDLLYSMALAPGQQKLVSQLDWERRETTRRTEHRTVTEELNAELSHDRDISDIIRSSLQEHMDAQSTARTSASGGGIGGFIGPIVFGAAGGVSNANSTANQASARNVAASALNQARDRTLQAASVVRGQRTTIVQTARQGESVRAQTEAIANYNHCHALTVEYFEVLRHFQVSQELAGVRECLFIPFEIRPFSDSKALRWRHVLQNMVVYHGGSVLELRPKFEALARVSENWANANYPPNRYADDNITSLSGDFWAQISIPKPADKADHTFEVGNWDPFKDLITGTTQNLWERYLGVALPENRQAIFNSRIAPIMARKMMDHLSVEVSTDGLTYTPVTMDTTLVSRFQQNGMHLISFRNTGTLNSFTRAAVQFVRIAINGIAVPSSVQVMVQSGSMRYRTDYFAGDLFNDYQIQNDLSVSDPVEVFTPLSKQEKANPRKNDRKEQRLLIDILNERVEYFHRVIWLTMDPNRRYMFLDGVLAPDAGGRSVASVVDNQIIGIVGNSLVMPVVPGLQLDSTYTFARQTPEDLRHLYASDPPPPMRISVPTRGVFAEAVLGKCNSCEVIDDSLYWRWEEAPIPDSPTAILPISTASRRTTPPNLTATAFPDAIVGYQNVPKAPDPTGLSASLDLLGTKGLFRDLTGLALNQENAASALQGVMSAAQSFASQGAALAQQKFLSKQMDRNLGLIKNARDDKQISHDEAQKMTESLFRGAIGERRPESKPVTDNPAIKRAVERVTNSESGEMRITRPGGTVEVKTGNKVVTAGVNAVVEPEVVPVKQKSSMSCWAAAGTMMVSWKQQVSLDQVTMLDQLGGSWRAKFDADTGLTTNELHGFAAALGLKEEGPASYTVEGLARLVKANGPLWVISDDSFEGNQVVHARIVTAVKGDGTIDGTTVTLVDPIPGTFVTETFTKFAQRLEANDVVKFGVGIYHW